MVKIFDPPTQADSSERSLSVSERTLALWDASLCEVEQAVAGLEYRCDMGQPSRIQEYMVPLAAMSDFESTKRPLCPKLTVTIASLPVDLTFAMTIKHVLILHRVEHIKERMQALNLMLCADCNEQVGLAYRSYFAKLPASTRRDILEKSKGRTGFPGQCSVCAQSHDGRPELLPAALASLCR